MAMLTRLSMMRRDVALQDLAQSRSEVDRISEDLLDLEVQLGDARACNDETGTPMLLQSEQFGQWVGMRRQMTLTALSRAEGAAAQHLADARTAVGRAEALEKLARAMRDENRQRRAKQL
jgi:hypothetical protein